MIWKQWLGKTIAIVYKSQLEFRIDLFMLNFRYSMHERTCNFTHCDSLAVGSALVLEFLDGFVVSINARTRCCSKHSKEIQQMFRSSEIKDYMKNFSFRNANNGIYTLLYRYLLMLLVVTCY